MEIISSNPIKDGTRRTRMQNQYQGSYGDWKTLKMKMVMEKSLNMKNWPNAETL